MIGIIGAMEPEIETLVSELTDKKVTDYATLTFYSGKIFGADVVIVRSGVGKVNAGICAQMLIDRFGVDTLINTGAAGSLDAKIDIGDIVISSDTVYHDMNATNFGYELGEVPQLGYKYFVANDALIESAKKAVDALGDGVKSFIGRVATGDEFVSNDERKAYIKDNFDALCCEMEGAAIAHAACVNEIPFVIIRAISDKADGSRSMDYDKFEVMAARHSASVVEAMLRELV